MDLHYHLSSYLKATHIHILYTLCWLKRLVSKCIEEHPQDSLYNSVLYISHAVEIFYQLWGYLSVHVSVHVFVCVSQCVCWDTTPNNELAEKAIP